MAKRIQVGGRIESKEVGGIVTGAAEILDDAKEKKQSVINQETDDELVRLEQSKQDNLTFDNAPTEGSDNPVKSGGLYTAQQAILLAIAAINELIPSAASALNQLADKAFVNSSISTNTATFRGTSAAGLNEQQFLAWANGLEHDLNDYVFWQTSDAAGNTLFKRYKWNGTEWAYEYTLNNSTFTAEQWEAIQSGITALLVAKLRALPTAQELIQSFDSKQDVLTFDDVPTLGSTNPVKSSGIYNVIKAITDLIPAEATAQNQLADKADVAAKIVAAIPSWKGQYDALTDLQAVTGAKAGDMGCVKTTDSDGHAVLMFYQYSAQGAWVVYYTLRHYAQNKPATTGTTGDYPYNGMGRIELQKNIVNGVNTLTQAMFTQQNTIYVIQYDFTLAYDVTIPSNCILEFDGGSISSGTIKGTFRMNDPKYKVFNNVTFLFGESFLIADYVRPEWFGAKGDYDWNTQTGTDDSLAFTNAFIAAEVLSIGKVKIMSSNYFISTGIHVTNGNVWLEGNRALLRDDQNQATNYLLNKGSMLVCPNNVNIITLDYGIGDPFRCTNVQFKCNSDNNNSIGIKCDGGGIWGFYVEYCHFEGFDKAITFQNAQYPGSSMPNYCIYNVYINNNTFCLNGYCVYFPTSTYTGETSLMDNFYTWQFEFNNNKAHHNARIFRVGCQFGVCNVSNNNLEHNYSSGDEPQSTIFSAQSCTLIFENNYFEANTIPLLNIVCYSNKTTFSAKNNNIKNVSNAAAKKVIVSSRDTISAELLVKNADIPIEFNNANNIVIKSEYPLDNIVKVINSDYIIFQTKHPVVSTKVFDNTGWNQRNFQCPSNFAVGSFKGDELFSKMVSYRASWGHTIVSEETIKTLIFFYMHIDEKENNGECLLANNNSATDYIFSIDGRTDKNYPYIYGFVYAPTGGTGFGIFTRNNTGVFVKEFGWALKDVDPSSEIPINIMNNLMGNINAADSISSITTLNNKKIGHRIYQKSNNKEYYYNGTEWVDATGTPV